MGLLFGSDINKQQSCLKRASTVVCSILVTANYLKFSAAASFPSWCFPGHKKAHLGVRWAVVDEWQKVTRMVKDGQINEMCGIYLRIEYIL